MKSIQEKTTTPKFTKSIDNLIVSWFSLNPGEMYEELKKLGFSEDEIVQRSKQLGLSSQSIKQCHLSVSSMTLRECLNCSERFLSAGFHNRLCTTCRKKN
jgi:hypothetical protein